MQHKRVSSSITLLAIFLLSTSSAVGQTQLRFAPEPGSEFQVRQQIEQDAQVNLGPLGAQQFNNTIVIESTQKALKGDSAHSSRIEQVMNRLRMDVRQGETVLVAFDSSESSDSSNIDAAMAPLLGQPLTIHLSDRGEVLSISGYDEMLSALPAIEDEKIRESLKQGLSEESVGQMMQMSLPTFPSNALTEGDTWTQNSEFSNPLFGTMKIKSNYAVAGLEECSEEECLRLSVSMDQTLGLDAGIFQQLKATTGISPELTIDEIRGSGTLWIATSDGMTLKSEINQLIKITMAIASEGQSPIEMDMSADQTIHQTIERR